MKKLAEKTFNEIRREGHLIEGELAYHLELFGDELAKENGYSESINGIDAVRLYLIRKYHWTPQYVKSMTFEDMRFVLDVEMNRWTIPEDHLKK